MSEGESKMYAYQNLKSQKGSEQKVPFQTKTNVVSFGNQSFSETITQRAEKSEEHANDLHTILSDRIRRSTENRTGLPDRLKTGIEALSGFSMDPVRVHFNSPKPAQLRAYAYTQGTDIYVAPGQEKHLPHEAWHVVQQMQDRVTPTDRINGENVNTSPALEREASEMGQRALNKPISKLSATLVQRQPSNEAAQLSHITKCDESARRWGVESETLVPDGKAIVVIECLTNDIENMKRIYAISCEYDRNTICVFGYNKSVNSKGGKSPSTELTEDMMKSIGCSARHLAYVFSFEWTPIPAESALGYSFPAVEARRLLMERAGRIAEELRDKIRQSMGGSSSSAAATMPTFVYRWMDQDAGNDSLAEDSTFKKGDEIKDYFDVISAIETPYALGGVYKWWLEEEDREKYAPGTKEFIDELNKSEILLRVEFKRISHYCGVNVIPTASELCGCYLPESTIVMNEAAHCIATGMLFPRDDSEAQDKESLRLLNSIGGYPMNKQLCFFSVTKPLKFIKDSGGAVSGSYLGTEFFRALYRAGGGAFNVGSLSTPASFFVALKNVRQSVFDNGHWYFINLGGRNWNGSESMPSGYGDGYLKTLKDRLTAESSDELKIKEECQKIFNALRAEQARILWDKYCEHILKPKKPQPPKIT